MDRVDPGRAGIGNDDAGGAEDRQPADDAEPRIHGALGERLAAGDRDLDLDVAPAPGSRRDLGEIGADHRARHRVDRRLAGRQRQARAGHRADALAGAEARRRARRAEAHRRQISAPWVTSGSSPASLMMPARALGPMLLSASAKAGRPPAGRSSPDRETRRSAAPKAAAPRRRRRRRWSSRGAGSRPFRLGHGRWPSARQRACLVRVAMSGLRLHPESIAAPTSAQFRRPATGTFV